MKTIQEVFRIIVSGDKEESRRAARTVRGLVYRSRDTGGYHAIKNIIDTAPNEYGKIQEDWRKENFVMSVSILYFLHDKEQQPDFLFPWLFQLLQHENGNIRYSAVRMIQHELGPLTYHVRFPGRKSSALELSEERADSILRGLQMNLDNLSIHSYKASYEKYTYVDELPSGTYKSVQLILGVLDEYCSDIEGDGYEDTLARSTTESREQIISRRKEIEKELTAMLKETNSDFTLEHIQDAVYHEEDRGDMIKIVAMFDGLASSATSHGKGASEIQNVLKIVSDVWNYFPHRSLGGISPAEKVLEHNEGIE